MVLADRMFSLVLLLNLTGLFSFVAPLLNVKVATVSVLMLALNLAYLGYRAPRAWTAVQRLPVAAWLVVVLAWPLLTVAYAPVLSLRNIGLQLYYASLLVAATVYVSVCGWRAMQRLAGAAVVVTLFGLLLSAAMPELFAAVARLTESRDQFNGRPFGFFMQPNMAAENSIYMSVLWLAGDRQVSVSRTWYRVAVMCATVLITGSRSGFAVALVVGLLALMQAGAAASGGRVRYTRGVRVLRATSVVLVVAVSFGLLLSVLSTARSGLVGFGLERVRSVLEFSSGNQVSADGSGAERLVAMAQYAGFIQQRPLTGYGLGANDHYKQAGLLIRSSHNTYLEAGFLYGVPFVLFWVGVMLAMTRHPARAEVEAALNSGLVLQLMAALAITALTSNTTLDSRVLQTGLGAMLGALAFPSRLRTPARAPARPVHAPAVAAPAPEPV